MGRSLYQLGFDENVRTTRSDVRNVVLGGGRSLQCCWTCTWCWSDVSRAIIRKAERKARATAVCKGELKLVRTNGTVCLSSFQACNLDDTGTAEELVHFMEQHGDSSQDRETWTSRDCWKPEIWPELGRLQPQCCRRHSRPTHVCELQ